MSPITKEFTKERVAEIIHAAGLEPCDYEEVFGSIKTGEIVAMARIALASLEAEPVGEVSEQRDGLVMDGMVDLGGASTHRIIKGASKMKRLPLGTKFYTAPPAPVSVPDAMEMDDDFDSAFEHGKAVGWNAYRAAMLQSFGNSEQLNSPVIQDGWVMVPEDPTHEMLEAGDEQFGTYDVYRRMIEAAPKLE
ncbi:hypothetical protein ACA365_13575 [Enterobacter roggenkampii]|uniref:hypothetical protein n=1 Tax=Enterobacter roggenkampii TaxID=1812935 RepID=UPI003BA12DFE